jgi:hypothetical protein
MMSSFFGNPLFMGYSRKRAKFAKIEKIEHNGVFRVELIYRIAYYLKSPVQRYIHAIPGAKFIFGKSITRPIISFCPQNG